MPIPIRVEVSFPLYSDFYETSKQISKIIKSFNGKDAGSGAGLGIRDMSFTFKDWDKAVLAEKAIKKLKIKGLEVVN